MKVERFAMAYRLLFTYALVRPESEQNSSHLQIDCDRIVGNHALDDRGPRSGAMRKASKARIAKDCR
jgi:hypothetical protein